MDFSKVFHYFVNYFYDLGMKWFFSQIKSQRDALDECMEPLRLVVNNPDQEKYPAAEKCIKQVQADMMSIRN